MSSSGDFLSIILALTSLLYYFVSLFKEKLLISQENIHLLSLLIGENLAYYSWPLLVESWDGPTQTLKSSDPTGLMSVLRRL
jgi:hypothetical protein